jgi:hypothetical protein
VSRTGLAKALASTVLATVFVTFLSTAPVAAKCYPARSNDGITYFDGWERDTVGVTVGGIYAAILNYSPWVYSGNLSTAWTMLAYLGDNWAQIGWIEYAGGVRYTVIQWTIGPNNARTKYLGPQSVGSTSTYTVLYNNTPGDFTFQVNGSTVDLETASFGPTKGENYGEIHTRADQMAGATQAHENFSNAHIYINGWQAFSGAGYSDDTSIFKYSVLSTTQTQIWDVACVT